MLSILGIVPAVLTFLTGLSGTASSISKDIANKEIAREQTKSNIELKKIDGEISALHDQKDIVVANAGNRLFNVVGFVMFLGPAVYSFKYFAIDLAVGGLFGCALDEYAKASYCIPFHSLPITPEMAAVMTAALGLFTLHSVFKK